MFNNKNILRLIGQITAFILILNTEACSCKAGNNNKSTISMEVDKTLLIGDSQKAIDLKFRVGDSGSATIGDFQLNITIGEQKTLKEGVTTTGSHIKYEGAMNDPETGNNEGDISKPFKKSLSEFTNYTRLDSNSGITEFEEAFTLVPADDAISVKVNFELTNTNGDRINNIDIQWIKSSIIIDPPANAEFIGEESEFTIINLEKDRDLDKLTVQLQSDDQNLSFLLGNTGKSEVTLEGLQSELGNILKLAKDQTTNPIKITVKNPHHELVGELTILVFATDASTDTLAQQTVQWSAIELNPKDRDEHKQHKEIRKKLEQEEKYLDEDEASNKKEIVKEKKEFQQKSRELKKQEKEELAKLNKKDPNYKDRVKEIKNQYNQEINKAKEEFEAIKKADTERIKADEKKKKADQKLLSDKEKERRKAEKEARKNKKESENSNALPQIVMVLTGKRQPTDQEFTIELANNHGKALTNEQAEKLAFWYELSAIGDASMVILKHGNAEIKAGDKHNLEDLLDHVVYADWASELKGDHRHKLAFTIHPGSTESMDIKLHLEGVADAEKTVTVHWQKKSTKNEKKKQEKSKKKKKGTKKNN